MNIFTFIKHNRRSKESGEDQNWQILDYLSTLDSNKTYNLLEVGSGFCLLPKMVKKLYPNIAITCIEKNPKLAQIARDEGFAVINEDVLSVDTLTEYDIVNCSHLIEHFDYPAVTYLLDKLVAWTKNNGILIIVTPLMSETFYNDIDHVRPYPPAAIMNYFRYEQQQKQSSAGDLHIEKLWYRTGPRQLPQLTTHSFIWPFPITHKLYTKVIKRLLNSLFAYSWYNLRWPASRPDTYVMITRVQK